MARYEVRENRREPLWDRVDRNRVRLIAFLVAFFAVSTISLALFAVIALLVIGVFVLAYAFRMGLDLSGVRPAAIGIGLLVAAGGASLVYMVWALTRDERWFSRRLEAPLAPKGELLETKYALKDMAIASGLDVAPALHVIETPNVNAFVFGWGNRRPIVGVTRGLTERLTVDEQRAVFANLMTRLRAGDTLWASAVTGLVAPLWRFSQGRMRSEEDVLTRESAMPVPAGHAVTVTMVNVPTATVFAYGLVMLFIVVSELLLFGHRSSQLRHAEVADAEGMLLLRDPKCMLSALEKSVRFNNFVPTAGPGMAQLFYCWTGDDSTDDEDDPENRRITRLREVLGVEGVEAPAAVPNVPVMVYPAAPRLEDGAPVTFVAPMWELRAEENRVTKLVGLGIVMAVAGLAVLFVAAIDASLPRQFADYGAGAAGDWLPRALLGYASAGTVVAFSLGWGSRRMSDALAYGLAAGGIYALVVAIVAGRFEGSARGYLFGLAIPFAGLLAREASRRWERYSGWK